MALIAAQINSCKPSNKHKSVIETPAAEETADITVDGQNEKTVHLEFPYDDLELLYKYTLKKLGVKGPFK
ncbi:MAG TPA: hypothetical protein GXX21_03350 [Syntrophomonadaceae bacterium]|nr:hypothetical protein [Syntrophomonadaceae bacterium]